MNPRYPYAPGVIVGGARRPRRGWALGRWLGALALLCLLAASLLALVCAGAALFNGVRGL